MKIACKLLMWNGISDCGNPSYVNTSVPHMSVACPSYVKVGVPHVSMLYPSCVYSPMGFSTDLSPVNVDNSAARRPRWSHLAGQDVGSGRNPSNVGTGAAAVRSVCPSSVNEHPSSVSDREVMHCGVHKRRRRAGHARRAAAAVAVSPAAQGQGPGERWKGAGSPVAQRRGARRAARPPGSMRSTT